MDEAERQVAPWSLRRGVFCPLRLVLVPDTGTRTNAKGAGRKGAEPVSGFSGTPTTRSAVADLLSAGLVLRWRAAKGWGMTSLELTQRRYARHLLLPEVGLEGQRKIGRARVLCIGAGGLGSPAALYLAAAGVGRLGLVDDDRVDLSNLARQLLHGTPDLGRPKTESAGDTLRRLNPEVEVVLHCVRFTSANALDLVAGYDLVIDGTDNLPARYLASDACVMLHKPNLYGAVYRFEGQASVLAPHLGGPCYRCLFPEPPAPGSVPSCAEGGVLGVMPGIIGCIQATEALKLILGRGVSLLGRLLLVDVLAMTFRELRLRRDPACAACGPRPTITRLRDYEPTCHLPEASADEVKVQEMKRALDHPELGIRVLDVREDPERLLASVPGTIHVPLSALPRRWAELDPATTYYVHCGAGRRSLQAVALLKQRGFASVKSVQGGLRAWASAIDPRLSAA